MRTLSISLSLLLAAQTHLPAQEGEGREAVRWQARSMTMTRYGIVAASQTLAAAAGAKILEAGGNAIDAAIATNAMLGLVEPTGNGVGGDLFAIVYEAKTGKLHGLNSSGWAPSGLTPEFLAAKGIGKMPQQGIYSVTVPGAVAGWEALHKKFGKLPWKALFAPAVHYAKEGYPVTELIANRWAIEVSKFKSPEAASTYLIDGKPPVAGQIFSNRKLAATLSRIAEKGRAGFYQGPVAEALLAASREAGGTFTAADLAEFQPEWVEPITTKYRGWDVYELPPNGHGLAALSMLNIMERFPMAEYGHNTARGLHTMIEAKKLAYADMLRYTGDPRFSQVPVAAMIAKPLGEKHAAEIDPAKAVCRVTPPDLVSMSRLPGADTIYMTAIDREGNMVSLIQSNYAGFGSGVVPAGTGYMLQNRGGLFTLEPNQPNTLAPRPLHTIIPGFFSHPDGRKISFGIMGGWNQAQAHAQFISNVVDHGMNIQAAMEAARFTKSSFDGCDVQMETRVPAEVRAALTAMGHVIRETVPYSQAMGGGQAVMVDSKSVHLGASDARKDGGAVPQSPAFATIQ
jgi:gamma-glutamyltranspeptidase/glutathione hydrolase